jgi:hypothetical protein
VTAEEIQDAAAVAVATMAAVVTAEEILDVAAVAVATVAAAVATEAAAAEEIQDAAAAVAVATMAAVEMVEEILAMEDTVVVTEIHTKVVTVAEILAVVETEILAVVETEVETKMIDPIPIKVIEHLNRIIESLLKQNRISLVPTRNQAVVAIVEKQKVELTPQHILKRRDSWVGEDHSHVINYATDQSTHAKAVVVGKLLVSVTSMHKRMIESISL